MIFANMLLLDLTYSPDGVRLAVAYGEMERVPALALSRMHIHPAFQQQARLLRLAVAGGQVQQVPPALFLTAKSYYYFLLYGLQLN